VARAYAGPPVFNGQVSLAPPAALTYNLVEMPSESRVMSLYSRHWPVLAAVVIVLYSVWVTVSPETMGGGLFVILLELGVRAAATLAAQRALLRIANDRQLRAWRYLAAGLLIWTLADAVTVLQWAVQGVPPVAPTLRDLLQVAGYFGALAAVMRFRTTTDESFGRAREVVDVAILVLGVFALAWLIFLGPAVEAGYLPVNVIFWLAIRPVLDLLLALLVARLLIAHTQASERRILLLLMLAFGVFFISDLAASMRGIYRYLSPPGLVEAGWMAGTLVLGLIFRQLPVREAGLEHREENRTPVWRVRLELLFPLVFTYAVVGILLFDWWYSGSLDWVGVGMAGLLIALMFARQGVIAGQQELRQFAALVNAAADMAFICDLDGRVRLANPSLKRALSIASEGESDWPLRSVLVETDAAMLSSMLDQAGSEGWSGEVVFQSHDGSRFPATLEMRPLGGAERSRILIAGTAHDLGEIRKRENVLRDALANVDLAREELAQLNQELESKVEERTAQLEHTVDDLARLNEELKALDKLKSEFVALVSHELRAPLTNIRSGIELLVERDKKLAGRTRESLELIQAETDRLTLFVETILDLSALDAGRVQLDLAPLDLEDVVNTTLLRFSQSERLSIDWASLRRLPAVLADQRALESVFYHVIDNALKYAPSGPVRIRADDLEHMVSVEVHDEGPGIPEDERERVFQMFHRLDSSDARAIYGHGLGLPMARRLVEGMGGTIEVGSSPGGGTLVMITLPAEESEKSPGSGSEGNRPANRKVKA
jgi:PAS domain S-box-containing protein